MQLADKLGINYETIGYIERGDHNPGLVLALSIGELFRLRSKQSSASGR